MNIELWSFGFKYGLFEGDAIFDVRFLPNPYYDESLRHLTGRDKNCADYVFKEDPDMKLVKALASLVIEMRKAAAAEKKPCLVIAIGCTGGQHRSVAVAEAVAEEIRSRSKNLPISQHDAICDCIIDVHHRDENLWSLHPSDLAI